MMMDRISNLPDNVIDIILEKLVVIERIKTSALSRSWRLRWTHLPSLTLDHRNIYRHLSRTNFTVDPVICLPIIKSILVQLESQSIKNLVLGLSPYTRNPNLDGDILLEFAVGLVSRMQDRSLERLNIDYNPIYDHPLYRLSSSALFSLLHLKHLTLTGCRICCLPFPSPSSSQSHQFQVQPGFPNLISFILMRCTVTALSSLLSNCPNLQNLQLELVDLGTDDHTLDFNAPKLRNFDIDPSCKNVILKNNANNLENLNFCMDGRPDKFIDSSSTLQIFSSSLKKVRLGGQACKRLALSAITLPTFSLVKDLQFRLISRYDLEQLQSLLRFCACCPHLERLKLHMLRDSSVHAADRDLQPEFEFESFIRKYSTTTFQLVKSVVLVQVFGAIWEMKIIEIILKMCPILEHMTILFRWGRRDNRPEIFTRILSFPRASSMVEFSCVGMTKATCTQIIQGISVNSI